MPNMTLDDFSDLNAMWIDAEEPEIGAPVPEGDYICRVLACRPERTQTLKRMLLWELVIVAGEYTGRVLKRNNMLESAQNVGWLKADLRKAGIDIDAESFDIAQFVVGGTGQLIGKLLKITVKKGKPSADGRENWNKYINEVAAESDIAAVNSGVPVLMNAATSGSARSSGAAGVGKGAADAAPQAAANPWTT